MKYQQCWEQYRQYQHQAALQYYNGEEIECWFCLLLAAEVSWAPTPSSKQTQQRKLSSQLWRVTGALGQLRQLSYEIQPVLVNVSLAGAIKCLVMAEERLRQEMRNL